MRMRGRRHTTALTSTPAVRDLLVMRRRLVRRGRGHEDLPAEHARAGLLHRSELALEQVAVDNGRDAVPLRRPPVDDDAARATHAE